MIPLPSSTASLARQNTHPGLALDKFVDYEKFTAAEQFGKVDFGSVQRPAVAAVADMAPPLRPSEYEDLRQRRNWLLAALGVKYLRAQTAGPFTLHLARASALENAGLCLHSVYGFAYLPATGLKGLARAYAETIEKADETMVLQVFGTSAAPKTSSAGAVVFHDAWPATWPKLVEDILNNHHAEYYSAGENKVPPPGDWEEPNMVSFLAVGAGVTFDFPLTGRRRDVESKLLDAARRWLLGGLTVLGAGAKTAAGYGHFVPAKEDAALVPPEKIESYALELVTPAFLAGANQRATDCELRPATLRGMLRWWWRTLHAGYVDAATLRQLESAVWGNTKIGGAARFTLETIAGAQPLPFERTTIMARNRLPKPLNTKTTQGLTYHSYGMAENKGQRSFIAPGAKWNLHLHVRESRFPSLDPKGKVKKDAPRISPEQIAFQARAALWLLCRFGGVGAKNHKGFGSFALPKGLEEWTLEKCRQLAVEFRTHCGLSRTEFNPQSAGSPAWEQVLPFEDIPSGLKNSWLVLDLVASSAQVFAQRNKHQRAKKALGLPRKIGRPESGSFQPGPHVKERHSSPVTYHLMLANGSFTLGVTAFPAAELPDLAQSQRFLVELLDHLQTDLPGRFADARRLDGPTQNPSIAPHSSKDPAKPRGRALKAGDLVQTIIIPDPKEKDRVFARVEETALEGNVINGKEMPAELRAVGTKVQLKIANINEATKSIAFTYPKPGK